MNDQSSFISEAIQKQIESLNEIEEKEKLPFSPLKLFFNFEYPINEYLTIHQPTIQDFIDIGDEKIYRAITPFIVTPTSYRVQLWDMGIDWNKITNLELFAYFIINQSEDEASKLLFGDFKFSEYKLYIKENSDGTTEQVLRNGINDFEINESVYHTICLYIRYMFKSFPPEDEFASNKVLKQDLINDDRQKQLARLKNNDNSSDFTSMISFCLNHPGFKYKKEELREVGIVEFMDAVQRLQIYESTKALMSGMYSGMCDVSKINKNEFNFMRDISCT